MSLILELNAQLTPLEKVELSIDSPQEINVLTEVGRLSITLADVHGLACAATELRLTSDTLTSSDADTLQQLSDGLCAELQYLLEPVSPIEIDRDSVTIQMRSNPPTTDENRGRSYYELVARQEGLYLTRFFKKPGEPRERIAMTFTREVLGRLAKDLVQSIKDIA